MFGPATVVQGYCATTSLKSRVPCLVGAEREHVLADVAYEGARAGTMLSVHLMRVELSVPWNFFCISRPNRTFCDTVRNGSSA